MYLCILGLLILKLSPIRIPRASVVSALSIISISCDAVSVPCPAAVPGPLYIRSLCWRRTHSAALFALLFPLYTS